MTVIPVLMLLSVAVVLGIVLGLQYLRRERSKPAIIGFHLLLGMGGLEVLAMLLQGTPNRRILPSGGLLTAAAALVMAAMFSGLIAPMVGRGVAASVRCGCPSAAPAPSGAHAAHQAPVAVNLAVLLARRVAQVQASYQNRHRRKKKPRSTLHAQIAHHLSPSA